MIELGVMCLIAGLVIDLLEALYVHYNHIGKRYTMTSIGALMGIIRLTAYTGIIQQGIEKGFIYIMLYATGNWIGGVLSFYFRKDEKSS